MEIKFATVSDIPKINALYRECSDNMISKFGLNHWENEYPQDTLVKRIENNLVYIVSREGEAVGTFMLEKDYPQPFLDAVDVDDATFRYLTRLAVSPNLQAKGLGSQIMKKAEELTKNEGADFMRLDILGHYEKLENFYKKNGYSVIGEGKTRRFVIKFMEKAL